MYTAIISDTSFWVEYRREHQLLCEWAIWVRCEHFIAGYGTGALRVRSPGVTPMSDDVMLPVDRAVAMTGPLYKRMLKAWYLHDSCDDARDMRHALEAFRWAYHNCMVEE